MLVSHSHEQEPPFWGVDGNLANELIEALAKQFFPDRTDALISCLPKLERFVQFLLEANDIGSF